MSRCTDCFNKTAYCTCWISQLSQRCHWCFHFMNYCTCPDMAEARSNITQKITGLLISLNTAEKQSAPLFGYVHPDKYQTYSRFITDHFINPNPHFNHDWRQSLLDDMMHRYDTAHLRCLTCLNITSDCTCKKK